MRRLSLIFVLGPVLMIGAYALASRLKPEIFPMADWTSWGLSCFLHLALSGVYVNLYTAVTGFSPSIGIVQRVEESMPHGLERAELVPPWFTGQNLSVARRENLLASGFIRASKPAAAGCCGPSCCQ